MNRASAALALWCAGFFTSTWDLFLTREVGGFTLKLHFLFFALAALSLLPEILAAAGGFFTRKPWLWLTLFAAYALATAPFSLVPVKSFAYTLWFLFDLAAIALPAAILFSSDAGARRWLGRAILLTGAFLALVTLTDYVAYFYGYKAGLIGFNQDRYLNWGASRPHAFSFEPSYLAAFFTPLTLYFFLGAYHPERSRRARCFAAFSLALSLATLFATGSRSGWLGAGLGFLLAVPLIRIRRGKWPRSLLASAAAGAVALALGYALLPANQKEMIRYRLVSELYEHKERGGGPTNARLLSIGYGIEMGKETYGAGTGLGASHAYWVKKTDPGKLDTALGKDLGGEAVMNMWAQVFAELGIPGLLTFAGFAATILFGLWRAPAGYLRDAGLVSAAVFFFFTAHCLGNPARVDMWVWFAIWGASLGVFPRTGHQTLPPS